MSVRGEYFAREALTTLLGRAESAWARDGDRNRCVLPFTESTLPAYYKLPQRADKDAAHAFLRQVERTGGISIEWDAVAGEFGHVIRIRARDAGKLADAIQATPLWASYQEAENRLLPLVDAFPNIKSVLERWRAGKLARGLKATQASDLLDAAKAITACRQQEIEEIAIRRLSVALFSDSKRLEQLAPALDALTTESLDVPGRDKKDVFGALGLVKFPQPILISGSGEVGLVDGTRLRVLHPYIGLAPQSIAWIAPDTGGYVLTVENLTTFHELSQEVAGPVPGLLIYTGGMPSPAFLRVYRTVREARAFHWGDIDLGGFRIAAHLADHMSQPLRLWNMNPACWPNADARKPLSDTEVSAINRLCALHGWVDEASAVVALRVAIEQEGLALRLPTPVTSIILEGQRTVKVAPGMPAESATPNPVLAVRHPGEG